MSKLFLLTTIIFLFMGCFLITCDWESDYSQLTTEPDHNKIHGIYILNDKSVKYLTKEGYNVDSCILKLKNDGQFILTKTPDLVFFGSFGQRNNSYETKTGKWSVSNYEESGCLMELQGICVEPFLQRQGKLAISITIGDPDQCEGIIFEKAE